MRSLLDYRATPLEKYAKYRGVCPNNFNINAINNYVSV